MWKNLYRRKDYIKKYGEYITAIDQTPNSQEQPGSPSVSGGPWAHWVKAFLTNQPATFKEPQF